MRKHEGRPKRDTQRNLPEDCHIIRCRKTNLWKVLHEKHGLIAKDASRFIATRRAHDWLEDLIEIILDTNKQRDNLPSS